MRRIVVLKEKLISILLVSLFISIFSPARAQLLSWITVNPNIINENQVYTIIMGVSNTGAAADLGTAPSLLSGTIGSLITPVQPASADIAAGGYQEYTWVYQALPGVAGPSAVNGIAANLTDTSTDITSLNTNLIEAKTNPVLSQDIYVAPVDVALGQQITIIMNVSNTGGSAAITVTPQPFMKFGAGGIIIVSAPVPADIVAGSNGFFTWIYLAISPGFACLSGNVQGFAQYSGQPVSSAVSSGDCIMIEFNTPTITYTPSVSPTVNLSETPTNTPSPTPTATSSYTLTPTNTPEAVPPPCFILKWGDAGTGDGQFDRPNAVAADIYGNVYVADTHNNRIEKFDSSGNFLAKWGSSGTGDGQFDRPGGIAVDLSGNVYVADTFNQRIEKFDAAGNFLAKWGFSGGGNGQFYNPYGIAISPSGNVYVADTFNDRIQVFDSSGNFLFQFAGPGLGNGQLGFPYGLAIAPSGNVYVADTNNNRIQEFTSAGVYVTQWGSFGSGSGNFRAPEDVAVDSAGNVYVVESIGRRVQKFDPSGSYITQWGSVGTGDGQFSNPGGITIDNSGNIYVADTTNDRVEKFGLCATATQTPSMTGTEAPTQAKTITPTGTLTCTPSLTPTLSFTPASTVSPSFTFTPAGTASPAYTITASATATSTNPACCGTPSLTVTPTRTPAAAPADLTINKSATGDQPEVGADVTFNITVRNDTAQDVSSLAVWDTLPAQLAYTGFSAMVSPAIIGNYISFIYPSVPSGGIVNIEITARVISFAEGYPIGNRAWCDYSDAYYAAPLRHPAITSNTAFYPANEPVVFPNPFNRGTAVNGVLKFENLVPGSLIQIFTLSAELVYNINSVDLTEKWAGKNMYGNGVSPGIYYYVITAPDKHVYTGKIFVVR